MTIQTFVNMSHRNCKMAMNAAFAAVLCFFSASAILGQSDPGLAPKRSIAPMNPDFVKWLEEKQEREARRAAGLPEAPVALSEVTDPYGRTMRYIPDPRLRTTPKAPLTQIEVMVEAGLAEYPPIFDPRTDPKTWLPSSLPDGLPNVRNQGQYGTCWAFSSIAALEYALVRAGTPTDLSEWHLAYFTYNPINGIPSFTKSAVDPGKDSTFDQGGNFYFASTILTRGDLAGGPVPLSSSTYGGAMPSPSTHSVATVSNAFSNDITSVATIKGLLQTYKVLTMSYKADDGQASNSPSQYYNPTYAAFRMVQTDKVSTNHAVNIVGWDDSFSKAKFPDGNQPSTDGAWIVRNSWGPYRGDGGYFYMSYDTTTRGIGYYTALAGADAKTYQYDMFGAFSAVGWGDDTAWFSNIFTASANHSIKAVSFNTDYPGATYQIYVRKGVGSTPSTGALALSPQSGSLPNPGYNRINLSSPVNVSAGEKFSVIVKLTDPGNTYPVACAYAYAGYTDSATATPGVGWLSDDGSNWDDITSGDPKWATWSICLKAFADDGTDAPDIRVAVTPKTASLQTGQTQAFTANVTGTSNTAVTWSVLPGHGTITNAGVYTAPAVAGIYTVTATSVADTSQSDTATVTVTSAPAISVSVTPKTASLQTGQTQAFKATVTGTTNQTVVWSTNGGSMTAGVYTAPAVAGIYTVTATSTVDTSQSDTATVTVTSAPAISVSVTPKTVSLQPGKTQIFTANVTGTSNTAVTWSVTSGQGTITQAGLYTAPAVAGNHIVAATSQADATATDTATIAVSAASIVFTSIPKALFVNGTAQLLAVADGLDNTAVKWSAGHGTITQAGAYTAPATVPSGDGRVAITATSDQAQDLSREARILIRPSDFANFGTDNNTKTSPQLLGLAYAFGSRSGEPKYDPKYDINGDGVIDDDDLIMLFKVMDW